MTLIDTAEMYADGGAEEVVGEAIAGRRAEVFLVSKVLPQHATRRGTIAACQASLKRLRTERLDLYLLHWRGSVPLAETLEAFETLARSGDIRYWGVSNFDTADMEEIVGLPGGAAVAGNQVLYNLGAARHRVRPAALVPRAADPDHGVLADRPGPPAEEPGGPARRAETARRHPGAGRAGVGPRARRRHGHPEGQQPRSRAENRAAHDLDLTPEDLLELDRGFPPPAKKVPLEML